MAKARVPAVTFTVQPTIAPAKPAVPPAAPPPPNSPES